MLLALAVGRGYAARAGALLRRQRAPHSAVQDDLSTGGLADRVKRASELALQGDRIHALEHALLLAQQDNQRAWPPDQCPSDRAQAFDVADRCHSRNGQSRRSQSSVNSDFLIRQESHLAHWLVALSL